MSGCRERMSFKVDCMSTYSLTPVIQEGRGGRGLRFTPQKTVGTPLKMRSP